MTWPSPQDYNEAIQNPAVSFEAADLRTGAPVLDRFGLPRPISGGFASVYKLKGTARNWAVRCFLHRVDGQAQHYSELKEFLQGKNLNSIIGFEFLEQGIKIHDQWFPILKMDWLDGETFNTYIERNRNDIALLQKLRKDFQEMIASLKQAGIVHGDLQHGNIMIVDGQLRLVDYDCMIIQGMNYFSGHELGHRNYQHPRRNSSHTGPYLDNFSAWVIDVSLQCLSRDGQLWREHKGGDECLLFRQRDFLRPTQSRTFAALENHDSSEIREAVKVLRYLCDQPIEEIPPLETIVEPPSTLPIMPLPSALPDPDAAEHWLSSWLPPGQSRFSESGIGVAVSSSTLETQVLLEKPKLKVVHNTCGNHAAFPVPLTGHNSASNNHAPMKQQQCGGNSNGRGRSKFFGLNYTRATAWAEPPTVADQLVKLALCASVCTVACIITGSMIIVLMYSLDPTRMQSPDSVSPAGMNETASPGSPGDQVQQGDQKELDALDEHDRGRRLVDEQKYTEAIPVLDSAYKKLQPYKLIDTDSIAACAQNLGFCHEMLGHFAQARIFYFQAHQILEQLMAPADLAREDYDIGRVALRQGDLKTAKQYLERAASCYETSQNILAAPLSYPSCLHDLETCYNKLRLKAAAQTARTKFLRLLREQDQLAQP